MIRVSKFDYDLWTTEENGEKRYWTRCRATGEICEVNHDVMCTLRREEKAISREIEESLDHGSVLSLDYLINHDIEESGWLEDKSQHVESETIAKTIIEELLKELTESQKDLFICCMLGSETIRNYARQKNINHSAAYKTRDLIRKKAEKYFF